MVPVSVRAEAERGALGNQVAAMYAPLPVGIADPLERFRVVHEAMGDLKESGQAVGAEVLTQLAGFAAADDPRPGRPPAVAPAAASTSTVTNVPGPQFPLYVLGRRLRAFYPQVPLAQQHGARDRDHVLRRHGRTSGCSATSTRCPTSTTSPATCRRRSPSSRRGRRDPRTAARRERTRARRAARRDARAALEAGRRRRARRGRGRRRRWSG